MNIKKILTALVVTVMTFSLTGCGGSDDSAAAVNTNVYNVRSIVFTDYISNLALAYSTGVTGTMTISRVYTGDGFVNGIPVKSVHFTTLITVNGTTTTGSSDTNYDSNGIDLENFASDSTICTLQNTPTPLPLTGKVGDSSTVTGQYTCTDGTSYTERWSILDAGNGNAYATFTFTDYDIANNIDSVTKERVTLNSSSIVTYLNLDIDFVSLGITANANGAVQLQ